MFGYLSPTFGVRLETPLCQLLVVSCQYKRDHQGLYPGSWFILDVSDSWFPTRCITIAEIPTCSGCWCCKSFGFSITYWQRFYQLNTKAFSRNSIFHLTQSQYTLILLNWTIHLLQKRWLRRYLRSSTSSVVVSICFIQKAQSVFSRLDYIQLICRWKCSEVCRL